MQPNLGAIAAALELVVPEVGPVGLRCVGAAGGRSRRPFFCILLSMFRLRGRSFVSADDVGADVPDSHHYDQALHS